MIPFECSNLLEQLTKLRETHLPVNYMIKDTAEQLHEKGREGGRKGHCKVIRDTNIDLSPVPANTWSLTLVLGTQLLKPLEFPE